MRMTKPIPTGPAAPPKAEAGPRRGSDAAQCSDRSRVPTQVQMIELARACCMSGCRAAMCKRLGECCAPGEGYGQRLQTELRTIRRFYGQSHG